MDLEVRANSRSRPRSRLYWKGKCILRAESKRSWNWKNLRLTPCLERSSSFLGLTGVSLGLNVQPRPPASAGQPSDLGWHLSDLGKKSFSRGMKSSSFIFPTSGLLDSALQKIYSILPFGPILNTVFLVFLYQSHVSALPLVIQIFQKIQQIMDMG